MKIEKTYDYKPGWSAILFGGVFFSVVGGFAAMTAMSNEKGLILNGLLTLGPVGATRFYWTLMIASFVFVLLSAALAYFRMTSFQQIKLTDEAIVAPRFVWTSNETTIHYSDIEQLSTQTINGQTFLNVVPNVGKKLTITSSFLPSKRDFEELCQLVSQKRDVAKATSNVERSF